MLPSAWVTQPACFFKGGDVRTSLLPLFLISVLASFPAHAQVEAPGTVFRDCPDCPEMVVIPPGSFVMGSPDSETGRDKDEGPQHSVTIAYPLAVGQYSRNGFGLHDMIGNAWEWTEDCYNDSYAGAPTDGSAWAAGSCARRVDRGASCLNHPRYARSAKRDRDTTGNPNNDLGFRLASMPAPA